MHFRLYERILAYDPIAWSSQLKTLLPRRRWQHEFMFPKMKMRFALTIATVLTSPP
jgi:hypothetical protein